MKKKVSIIIPAFNEVENIIPIFNKIEDVFYTLNYNWDVLFIDDGSSDSTLDVFSKLSDKSNFKFILWAIIFLIIGYFLNQYLFSILNWVFSFLVII